MFIIFFAYLSSKLFLDSFSFFWKNPLENSFPVGGGGLVAQLCLTLCDAMDCSPSGSSIHEISQARILEWVAIPFSRGSSQVRDRTHISYITSGFFTVWASRETPKTGMRMGIYRDQCNPIQNPEINSIDFWQSCEDHSTGKESFFQQMVLKN